MERTGDCSCWKKMEINVWDNIKTLEEDIQDCIKEAYNFHYERARIALPRLSQEKRWMQVMNTADHIGQTFEPVALEEQGHVEVAPQSISILISCAEQGKEYNESVRAL